MAFLRLTFLVLLFTALGLGIMFFSNLRPVAEGLYAFYQGYQAYEHNDYTHARLYYRQALKHSPNTAQVYLFLGDAEHQLNHPKAALFAYQKALEMNPGSSEAIKRVAMEEWSQGRRRLALGLYLDSLQKNPKDMELRSRIGDLYLSMARESGNPEDFKRAGAIFAKFLQKNPQDDSARYKLAESLYAQGRYNDALTIYCDLATKYPESPETLYSLAVAFAKNEAPNEAHRYMIRAAEQVSLNSAKLSQKWAVQALSLQQSVGRYKGEPATAVTNCVTRLNVAEEKASKENAD